MCVAVQPQKSARLNYFSRRLPCCLKLVHSHLALGSVYRSTGVEEVIKYNNTISLGIEMRNEFRACGVIANCVCCSFFSLARANSNRHLVSINLEKIFILEQIRWLHSPWKDDNIHLLPYLMECALPKVWIQHERIGCRRIITVWKSCKSAFNQIDHKNECVLSEPLSNYNI